MDYILKFDLCKKEIIISNNIPYSVDLNSCFDNKNILTSSAIFNNHKFIARSDFYGINTHYWFKDEKYFICSNSLLKILENLPNVKINKDDIYDILFFGFNLSGRTIFENIRRLKASEKLNYDLIKGMLNINKMHDLIEYFNKTNSELNEENMAKIIDNNFSHISLNNPTIALSAGSDTRTILATLMKYNIHPEALSFGNDRGLEMYEIKKLCKKYKVNLSVINPRIESDNYIKWLRKLSRNSNYLINGQNIHIAKIFKSTSVKRDIFLGLFGSEFLKGVLSELMISYPFKDLINGVSIKNIISKHFCYLKNDVQMEMGKHIENKIIKNVICNDKNSTVINYSFYNLPSNVFAGPIIIGQNQGYNIILPYLLKDILKYAFSTGFGITNNNNIMDNYNWRKSFIFQSKWVKLMSKKLYMSFMYQYGGSLWSVPRLPRKVNILIKKIYEIYTKMIYRKPFTGLIERNYLNCTKREYIKNKFNDSMIANIIKGNTIHNMDRIKLDNIIYLLICEEAISNKKVK